MAVKKTLEAQPSDKKKSHEWTRIFERKKVHHSTWL